MTKKAAIDWEAIKRDWRIGQLTAREIARQHGVVLTTLTRRAARENWQKDLTEEVKTRTRAALLLGQGPENATERNTATEADIDLAVRTNVELIRQHQGRLGRLTRVAEKLLEQLEMSAELREELEEAIAEETSGDKGPGRRNKMLAAVALPSHAAIVRELSQVMKNVIPLERQAFNLDEQGNAPKQTAAEISDGMTTKEAADAYAATLEDNE